MLIGLDSARRIGDKDGTMTTDEARALVAKAKTIEDVLGPEHDDASLRLFRRLVHPDRCGGDEAAWAKLEKLAAASRVPTPAPAPEFSPLEIRTRSRTYALTGLLARGDLCDVYESTRDGQPVVVKVAGTAADADLLDAEARALRGFPAEPGLRTLVPWLADSFEVRAGGERRRVNVIGRAPVGHVSVAEICRAYSRGLDYRDAAWIARRLLAALGYAHSRGVVHAAALPDHVLVHPTEHTALLVDWCYSVRVGEPARAAVGGAAAWYPPELLSKRPLGPQADIYIAGRCFAHLLGWRVSGDWGAAAVPPAIRAFVASCLLGNPARRPTDALALHDELGDVMQKLVGPPKFRPLAMPPASTST